MRLNEVFPEKEIDLRTFGPTLATHLGPDTVGVVVYEGAFQKLRKIITLEREQGCVNRAVIGGLGRFLAFWEQDATKESSQPDELRLIKMITEKLKDYGAQDIAARVRNTDEVLAAISEIEKKHSTGASAKVVGKKVEKPARHRPSQSLDSPVTSLRGVSIAYAKKLQRLGVTTINDLLYLFPRQYDDFSALKTISHLMYGEEVTVLGRVEETRSRIARSGIVNHILPNVYARGERSCSAERWENTWDGWSWSPPCGSRWTKK